MLSNYVAENYFRSVKAQQNLQEYLLKFFSYVEKPKWLFLRKPVSFALDVLRFSLTNYTFWCRVVQNSVYTFKDTNFQFIICTWDHIYIKKGQWSANSQRNLIKFMLQYNTDVRHKYWRSGPQQHWSVGWDCSITGDIAMCWNAEPSHFLPSSSCSGAPSLSLCAQLEQEQEHWDPQLQSD